MCRANSDPRGGYRCMPPKGYLVSPADGSNMRNLDSSPGAFWLENSYSPTLEDIMYAIENLNQNSYMPVDKLEEEILHIGHMVTLYSDSKVDRLDTRLKEIQNLSRHYAILFKDNDADEDEVESLGSKISDLSLGLGSETRACLIETLKGIRNFGTPLANKLHGDKRLVDLVKANSEFFPSQWNKVFRGKMKVVIAEDYDLQHGIIEATDSQYQESTYKGKVYSRELWISQGQDGYLAASSVEQGKNFEQDFGFNRRHEVIHEMSHMYEMRSSDLVDVTDNFYWRRVKKDASGKALNPVRSYSDHSHVRSDDFASLLIGQHYRPNNGSMIKRNEIFARGTESVLFGANGSLIGLSVKNPNTNQVVHYNPDAEHRNLIVGFLAALDLGKDTPASWLEKITAPKG